MVVIYLIIFFIFWPIWFYSPNVSTDFPLVSEDILKAGFNTPLAWHFRTMGFGENSLFTLWSWPIDFLYGLLSTIGVNFDFIQIILGMVPVTIISIFSLNLILKDYKISYKARVSGILFYLLNSYILLLIDGGQLIIALAYALLPLNYYLVTKATRGNFKSKLVAGLSMAISGFCDIRFLGILFIILLVKMILEVINNTKAIFPWIYTGVVIFFIFLFIHFYWIFPVLKFGLELPNMLLSSSNVDFLSFAKLKHAVLLLQPHWFKNSFGFIEETRKEFILIPLLAFIAPLISKKRKQTLFWVFIAVLGIFLTKGSNPPFENIYTWSFENIPGFFLFRDPSKFFFLVCLSYSVLIAFTMDRLVKFKQLTFGLFIFYILILSSPVYLGKMSGLFSDAPHKHSFYNVSKILDEDKSFGRVLWVPSRHPLAFSSLTHPVIELSRIQNTRIFSVGNFGTYETANFLRESEHIAQLLDISNINYIVLTYPDERKRNLSEDEKKYYEIFSAQLSSKDYLETKYKDNVVSVYKVKSQDNNEKFFIAENSLYLTESDEVLNNFSFNAETKLKDNAIVYQNERNSDFYYPSDFLENSPNSKGWWKREAGEFLWLRNFLQEKYSLDNQDLSYGGGYAICEGNCLFKLPESTNSWREIYIRKLVITNDKVTKKLSGYESTSDKIFEFKKAKFDWLKLDKTSNQLMLHDQINIINALSPYLPEKDSSFLTTSSSTSSVTFEMVNPAHYIVNVSGISKDSLLVFSENYSKHWKMNGQTSIKVYDLFNGFNVDKDGVYDIYFEPQKYVNLGFVVSMVSLIALVTYIIKK